MAIAQHSGTGCDSDPSCMDAWTRKSIVRLGSVSRQEPTRSYHDPARLSCMPGEPFGPNWDNTKYITPACRLDVLVLCRYSADSSGSFGIGINTCAKAFAMTHREWHIRTCTCTAEAARREAVFTESGPTADMMMGQSLGYIWHCVGPGGNWPCSIASSFTASTSFSQAQYRHRNDV